MVACRVIATPPMTAKKAPGPRCSGKKPRIGNGFQEPERLSLQRRLHRLLARRR